MTLAERVAMLRTMMAETMLSRRPHGILAAGMAG
jgi:hypothetical protein